MTAESPCQACGACCSYSRNWPRFTTEDDATLDLIPQKFVNERLSGMRCDGDRCSALSGKIGVATACTIYAVRPEVCRTCMPGDVECAMARRRHGLPALAYPPLEGEGRTTKSSGGVIYPGSEMQEFKSGCKDCVELKHQRRR